MLSTRDSLIHRKLSIRIISYILVAITRVTSLAGAVFILGVSPAPAQVQTTLAADDALPRLTKWLAPRARDILPCN